MRLALCAVDDDGIDIAGLERRELHSCGEACASKSDNAALANSRNEGVKIVNYGRLDALVESHKSVALYSDGIGTNACGTHIGLDAYHSSRNGCIHGRGYESLCLCDLLSDLNRIALLNKDRRGCADVL